MRNASGVDVVVDRTGPNDSSYFTVGENPVANSDMRSTFDLLPITGGLDLPSFEVRDLFDMPPEIQLNSQSVDIAGTAIGEGSFLFSWEHDVNSDDYVVVTVDVYNQDWSQYFGSVYCIANDAEGLFRIPTGTIAAWEPGNMMNIQVGRMRTVNNILPHDASGVVFPALNWSAGFMRQR